MGQRHAIERFDLALGKWVAAIEDTLRTGLIEKPGLVLLSTKKTPEELVAKVLAKLRVARNNRKVWAAERDT